MFCNHCGYKLRENAAFCPKCGTKAADAVPLNQVQNEDAGVLPSKAQLKTETTVQGFIPSYEGAVLPEQKEKKMGRKRGALIISAISFVLIAAIVIGIVLILPKSSDNRAYMSYISRLNERYEYIFASELRDGANCVAIYDVYGDSTPELIYCESKEASYGSRDSLHIVSYENGELRDILSISPDMFFMYYSLCKRKGDDAVYLFLYGLVADGGIAAVYSYVQEGDKLIEKEQLYYYTLYSFDKESNETYWEITYRKNGEEQPDISRDEFNKEFIAYSGEFDNLIISGTPNMMMIEQFHLQTLSEKAMPIDTALNSLYEMAGEEPPVESEQEIFSRFAGNYAFTNGLRWKSLLTLNPDGSFTGSYYDYSYAGGDGYKEIQYSSSYRGRFINARRINHYTYAADLETIVYDHEPGTEEIKKSAYTDAQCLYKYTEAYGLANGTKTIYFYTARAPIYKLPDDFTDWIDHLRKDKYSSLLEYNCFYTVDTGYSWLGQRILNNEE